MLCAGILQINSPISYEVGTVFDSKEMRKLRPKVTCPRPKSCRQCSKDPNWDVSDSRDHPLNHSIQFSHSVMSNSLQPHEPQHARPPCPSPIPGVYPNSCPLSRWWHPTISSSVIPFSSCIQSFSASGSFPMNRLCASGGTGASASASVLPMNIQDWFPLGWTGMISLLSKGALKSLLQHHSSKASILWCSAFLIVQLSHPYITPRKTIALTILFFDQQSCLCFLIYRLALP